jgi:hypothetical protein
MKCQKKVVPLIQPIKIRHIPETQASKVGVRKQKTLAFVIQPNTKSKFSYIEHILIPKIFFVKVPKKFGFLKNASHLCCTLREGSGRNQCQSSVPYVYYYY